MLEWLVDDKAFEICSRKELTDYIGMFVDNHFVGFYYDWKDRRFIKLPSDSKEDTVQAIWKFKEDNFFWINTKLASEKLMKKLGL